MAVLVDAPVWPFRDRLWAHLISDVSYAELHEFAARLGLPERAFHRDHYDLPADRHAEALALGARQISGREVLAALRRAGLRRPAPQRPRPAGQPPDQSASPSPDPIAGG
ncbi:MAG: DUF4031 domain-containing protein [Actinomycetota bacterium]|nr:DUF4031 domain-containing protein [Actinomycetota bacterium]